MTAPLPDALLLAWWGTAWLQGHTSTDDLLDAMQETTAVHSVRPSAEAESQPGLDVEGTGLVPLLGALRRARATQLGATFPAEGDPLGLGGPLTFNRDATEVGHALLCPDAGLGAVPHRVGSGLVWTVHPARPRPLPDLAEADRGLRTTLLHTVDALERLDVASWSPAAADEVLNLHHRPVAPQVPGVPLRARDLAMRAISAHAVAEAALQDHGGAVSAAEVVARAEAVRGLDRAARVALTAAASAWCWPPDTPEA